MSERPRDTDPHGHAASDSTIPSGSHAASGNHLGPFLLRERIGSGGMGEVWKAEQTSPVRRTVALKLIKAGMDSREVLARFEAERQALALMDHPCIAKVFDAGTTPEGRPWFAMEYVQGIPITDYCDRRRLSTEARLRLFQRVCEGVQHAHQKAVLHRDLKPGNVLVADVDGQPLPKIIDFGVAKATTHKLTERTMYTALGQLIGTPEYMSPEQAELTGEDVDTRTDVYSLGVILYQLLVGALPFEPRELRKAGFEGIVRMLREQDPPRPSTRLSTLGAATEEIASHRRTGPKRLASQLRGDLDWIVMRCLEKDRNRRYGSPQELRQDVERHLEDEPVLAGPPSAGYRARKFMRRNRLGVGIGAAAMIVLVGFSVMMAVQSRRIAAERDRANREAVASERVSAFLADMFRDINPARFGAAILDQLNAQVAETRRRNGAPPEEIDRLRRTLETSLRAVNLTSTAKALLDAEILERAAARIELDLDQDPLIAARLHQTLGEAAWELTLVERCASQTRKAYEIGREFLGEEHPTTLASLLTLARVELLQDVGSLRVDSITVELLNTSRRILGIDHPQTLEVLAFYAERLHAQAASARGKENWALWSRADSVTTAAYEARRRILGPDHEQTLESMYWIADMHRHQSRLEECEATYRDAVERSVRALGPNHRQSIVLMRGQAELYLDQNRYREAENVIRKVIESAKVAFGSRDRETIASTGRLGRLMRFLGDYPQAESLLQRRLDAHESGAGTVYTTNYFARQDLIDLYVDWKRYGDAERHMLESLQAIQRITGDRSKEAAVLMGRLSSIYVDSGRLEEAERLLLDGLEILRAQPEPDVEAMLTLSDGLARCYQSSGRLVEAERWHRDTLAEQRRVLGDTNEATLASTTALAELLMRAGRADEARPLLEEAIAARRRLLRELDAHKTAAHAVQQGPAVARDRLARLLMEEYLEILRDPDEALTLALDANEVSDYRVPRFLDTLARAYHLTGSHELSAQTLRRALELIPIEVPTSRRRLEERLRVCESLVAAQKDG